nr:MAG TPA: hypothetical protein [Caudoviricetes sp.]
MKRPARSSEPFRGTAPASNQLRGVYHGKRISGK